MCAVSGVELATMGECPEKSDENERQERASLEMSVRHNSDSAAYRPRQSRADFAIDST